jgi:dihydroorotase
VLTRREFSKLAVGSSLLAAGSLGAAGTPAVLPGQAAGHVHLPDCDLLVKGGTVVDPGQKLHTPLDVAVKDGKILEVSPDIPESRALKVFPAKNRLVTPGFIDLHVHCFDGFGGMNADHSALGRGVTSVVDCGSTGYLGIGAFVKYVVKPSATRVRALVNIAALGLIAGGSNAPTADHDPSKGFLGVMNNPDWVYPEFTGRAAEENKPAVVGIKVRLEKSVQGSRDLECLKDGLEAAEAAGVPLMAHIDDPYSPLPDILKLLRKGDVFTHIYNSHEHGVLDASGKVLPEVLEARERGVFLDPAQGRSHFSFEVVDKCLQQNLLPDTISTDLTAVTATGVVYDLPTMVSKFMMLGLSLDQAIERVTAGPARIFDYGTELGTLRQGCEADIGIF